MKKKKSRPKPAKAVVKKVSKPKVISMLHKAPVTPLGDRVLVKPLSLEEMGTTTSFGIIIPESAKEKPEQGTVVAVGPGRKTDDGKVVPVGVKVGDRVMFNKYGYEEVKVGGVEYYIVNESNILAILA